jgi:ABC-2 type transport system permease protein
MSSFYTVTKKELQDHFNSWRFIILLFIIVAAIAYVYFAAGNIKSAITGSTDFIFLSLFTSTAVQASSSLVPSSFLSLMATLIPVAGIILGLDAINSERNNGTLSRLVSQPIYRDNIINAKFFAGLITIGIVLLTIVLLVSAMGLRILGVPPSVEEIWRLIFFLVIGIIYGGFWLGLAILFSTLFKQVAVSAILAIAVWLFFAVFYPIIYIAIANSMSSATQEAAIKDANTIITLTRLSPIYLFNESMAVTLMPGARSASQILTILTTDAGNYLLATPLSLAQSLIAVWPQIISTIVLTAVCFVISYVKFMFEEIRAL